MSRVIEKNEYRKASDYLYNGAIITYVAGILLMIAFCSPYWVKSYEETLSEFKNMGLWEYCFENFRYPFYQFDHPFSGCHHVFSHEYHVIREWLLPPWLMAVQAFVTMSFLLSFISQALMALILCRWPLKFVIRYEYILSAISFVCIVTTSVFMFLAVVIFAGSYTRKDWLLYPNFNFLSWSYCLAVISWAFHSAAGWFLYKDSKLTYDLRKESKSLIIQMDPNPHHHRGW